MKEAAAEVGAIGAAQYVADRLDEAANGPQGDERAEPQENPRSRRHHLADRPRQRPRDRRRHDRANRVDRRLSPRAAAEPAARGGKPDEEGAERDRTSGV